MPALTRATVRTAIKARLEAWSYFATRTVKAHLDNMAEADRREMEAQIRARGVVLAVTPILQSHIPGGDSGSTRTLVAEEVRLAVMVRTNTTRNADADAAQVDVDTAPAEVMRALLDQGGTAALRGIRPAPDLTALQPDDEGILTTAVFLIATLAHE